jgi:hypothetical protein
VPARFQGRSCIIYQGTHKAVKPVFVRSSIHHEFRQALSRIYFSEAPCPHRGSQIDFAQRQSCPQRVAVLPGCVHDNDVPGFQGCDDLMHKQFNQAGNAFIKLDCVVWRSNR